MTLLTDLQGAVKFRAARLNGAGGDPNSVWATSSASPNERAGAALERADFEEQFSLAVDDAERVEVCQRWLSTYRRISNEERSAPRRDTDTD